MVISQMGRVQETRMQAEAKTKKGNHLKSLDTKEYKHLGIFVRSV